MSYRNVAFLNTQSGKLCMLLISWYGLEFSIVIIMKYLFRIPLIKSTLVFLFSNLYLLFFLSCFDKYWFVGKWEWKSLDFASRFPSLVGLVYQETTEIYWQKRHISQTQELLSCFIKKAIESIYICTFNERKTREIARFCRASFKKIREIGDHSFSLPWLPKI